MNDQLIEKYKQISWPIRASHTIFHAFGLYIAAQIVFFLCGVLFFRELVSNKSFWTFIEKQICYNRYYYYLSAFIVSGNFFVLFFFTEKTLTNKERLRLIWRDFLFLPVANFIFSGLFYTLMILIS